MNYVGSSSPGGVLSKTVLGTGAEPDVLPPPQNRLAFVPEQDCFTNNGGKVKIAMTKNRMRIGCTEITLEAAEKLMEQHRRRFGKCEEVWERVQ